jgi:nucleotide-binding universal stress UspA family protein
MQIKMPSLLGRLTVGEVMTRDVPAVAPDTGVEAAARLARTRQVHSLSVREGGELAGIVKRAQLLGALIELLEDQAPTTFGHLLVPTDFGRPAARVVCAAMELARRQRARVTLLHVLPRLWRVALMGGVPPDTRVQRWGDRREECLARLRALAFQGGEVGHIACQVGAGDPAVEIVKVSARVEADLIVMGTRGRRGLARLVRGSVAAAVIRRAPCPVLVIKG